MLGAVAEYERAMVSLRLRSGRTRKAEKGGYAFGSPPLGYRAEHRDLVPVEAEQAALARIAELHAGGASLREMAQRLAETGLRPKRGGDWHPETLRRIVARL